MNISPGFHRAALLSLALSLLLSGGAKAAAPGIAIQSGQKIGFMGDSITAQANAPDGYIGLVIYALKVEGIDATPIPAGVPGHTSGNMKGRVGPQILDQGANWMTLSCGVNDVMMQKKGRGVDLDSYKKNVTGMVEACLAKNVKVILLTATPLGEDLASPENAQLAGYNDFLRSYAKEKSLPLAEVNGAFQDYLKATPDPSETVGKRLLVDGIHPNKLGQSLMAKAVLIAMGVPASDLPKIENAWLENPAGKEVKLSGGMKVLISQNQYNTLVKMSKGHPASVAGVLEKILISSAVDSSKAVGAPSPLDASFHAKVDEYIKSGGAL